MRLVKGHGIMFWCFLSFYFINHIESFLYFALWVLRQWMFGFALTVSHSTTTHANSLSGIDSHLKALHARKLFPRSETKLTSASEELLIWCTEAEIICIKCGYFNILQCNKSLSLWYPLLRLGHATVIIGYRSGWFSDGKKNNFACTYSVSHLLGYIHSCFKRKYVWFKHR